jgi:hypothetical protein
MNTLVEITIQLVNMLFDHANLFLTSACFLPPTLQDTA